VHHEADLAAEDLQQREQLVDQGDRRHIPTAAIMCRMTAPAECILVLASASPRRRRLISWLGLPVEFMAVDTPEELDTPLAADPAALASHLAAEKARAAQAELAAEEGPPTDRQRVIVAFDTIVVLDGQVLGKPDDVDDGWRMLRALSGRTHEVVTGVAIAAPGTPDLRVFSVTTRVRMKALDDDAIREWMASGEFMGCAGAYNIESQIAEVDADECFENVAGLPLCHLCAALAEMELPCDASGIRSPVGACNEALARSCLLEAGR
jgi:septum formation protein